MSEFGLIVPVRAKSRICIQPVWISAATASKVTGLSVYELKKLVRSGAVRAKKLDASKSRTTTVYNVADLVKHHEKVLIAHGAEDVTK